MTLHFMCVYKHTLSSSHLYLSLYHSINLPLTPQSAFGNMFSDQEIEIKLTNKDHHECLQSVCICERALKQFLLQM